MGSVGSKKPCECCRRCLCKSGGTPRPEDFRPTTLCGMRRTDGCDMFVRETLLLFALSPAAKIDVVRGGGRGELVAFGRWLMAVTSEWMEEISLPDETGRLRS